MLKSSQPGNLRSMLLCGIVRIRHAGSERNGEMVMSVARMKRALSRLCPARSDCSVRPSCCATMMVRKLCLLDAVEEEKNAW